VCPSSPVSPASPECPACRTLSGLSAFCQESLSFKAWISVMSQTWVSHRYTNTHTRTHPATPTAPIWLCMCVCIGHFSKWQTKRAWQEKTASKSFTQPQKNPKSISPTHTHTHWHTFLLFHSVCVYLCVWGRQFAKHLLNLISPARSILDFSPPLSPLFTFHFELPG